MKLSDFDYKLPKEMIAQQPISPRDHSNLMVLNNDKIENRKFYEIINFLNKDDVLILNESKVLKTKITGRKASGGPAELIIIGKDGDLYDCRIKAKNPKVGTRFIFNGIKAQVVDLVDDVYKVRFGSGAEKLIMDKGELPAPPYVKQKIKDEWYQTVYALKEGSLAAPTAGLHFTEELLKKIEKKGIRIAKVCLHVSFSTFIPIASEDIVSHKMENEYFEIDKKNADLINNCKGKLVVVGTTTLKTLESAADVFGKIKAMKGSSDLFIYPKYKFKLKTSALVTNFHLPKSTLLLLVSAFYGKEKILNAYEEAKKKNYRFYSFGDAMMLMK